MTLWELVTFSLTVGGVAAGLVLVAWLCVDGDL